MKQVNNISYLLRRGLSLTAGFLALSCQDSLAVDYFETLDTLPVEMTEEIFSYLNPEDLRSARFNHRSDAIIRRMDPNGFAKRLERIERLLELNQFIPLPDSPNSAAISPIGISQELWVEVMGDNPSYFKDKKYCPTSHKTLTLSNGNQVKSISMCPDFPVERIKANYGANRLSDQEFIERLNQLFKIKGVHLKFRRATSLEYAWADTEAGNNPKVAEDPKFWMYSTYYQISMKSPSVDPALNVPSPSGERQTHSVKAKKPNSLGFYRSAVLEWSDERSADRADTLVMGGSYYSDKTDCQSNDGYPMMREVHFKYIGAGRLVKLEI